MGSGSANATEHAGLTLYLFHGSNACLTATLMLGHKRLVYRERRLPPVLHAFVLRALGFGARTVPALKVGSRRVQGSREIGRALDELVPEPRLYPSERREVEEAERQGEEFQNLVRRLFYWAARRDPDVFRAVIAPGFGPRTRGVLRALAPVDLRVTALAHGSNDRAVRADLAALPGWLDRIDGWIAAGVLDGPELNAADFQIAANTRGLLHFADLAPQLAGRPLEAHARRVAPPYGGDVPPVFPRQWLAA